MIGTPYVQHSLSRLRKKKGRGRKGGREKGKREAKEVIGHKSQTKTQLTLLAAVFCLFREYALYTVDVLVLQLESELRVHSNYVRTHS